MHVTESSTPRYIYLTASSTTVDSLLDLGKYTAEFQKKLIFLLEYRAQRLWNEASDQTKGDLKHLDDPKAAMTHKIWHEFHKSDEEFGDKELTDLECDHTIRQRYWNLRIAESKSEGLPVRRKFYETVQSMDYADRPFRDVQIDDDLSIIRPTLW